MTMTALDVDIRARDLRFLRAAKEVLNKYQLERLPLETPEGAQSVVTVSGPGLRSYTITFRNDWSAPPQCTCPDARNGGAARAGGLCKHAIAAALTWEDLRCQLLDALI